MKIYIIRSTGRKIYFSSLKKATKFIVDNFVKTLTSHNEPNYFLSQWPNPKSWIDAEMYKVFEIHLDADETAIEIDKTKLHTLIDKCSKEI